MKKKCNKCNKMFTPEETEVLCEKCMPTLWELPSEEPIVAEFTDEGKMRFVLYETKEVYEFDEAGTKKVIRIISNKKDNSYTAGDCKEALKNISC